MSDCVLRLEDVTMQFGGVVPGHKAALYMNEKLIHAFNSITFYFIGYYLFFVF